MKTEIVFSCKTYVYVQKLIYNYIYTVYIYIYIYTVCIYTYIHTYI